MCIIVYKPENQPMPFKKTLRTCFENNPDGAGYMFVDNGKVHIEKGFMTFNAFWRSLREHSNVFETSPFVMHFRISTQAGIRQDCCHPFPLSPKMDNLRKLRAFCSVGVAHNGIIDLTSTGYYYSKTQTVTHSDTMEFITDYLSLIINSKDYYKNENTLLLIERLADSKLAILDNDGHCELVGKFTLDNGIYYSNASYLPRLAQVVNIRTYSKAWDVPYDDYDDTYYSYPYNSTYWENKSALAGKAVVDDEDEPKKDEVQAYVDDFYVAELNQYDFDPMDCPATLWGDTHYCEKCACYNECYSVQ